MRLFQKIRHPETASNPGDKALNVLIGIMFYKSLCQLGVTHLWHVGLARPCTVAKLDVVIVSACTAAFQVEACAAASAAGLVCWWWVYTHACIAEQN